MMTYTDLRDPYLYIDRELGRVRFILQVLQEAVRPLHPMLERVKFLAIVSENLDEFFMVRVARLHREIEMRRAAGSEEATEVQELLTDIRSELLPGLIRQHECWRHELLPALREAGIHVLDYEELDHPQRQQVDSYVRREILPDLAIHFLNGDTSFAAVPNLNVNLLAALSDAVKGEHHACVAIPRNVSRLLPVSIDGLYQDQEPSAAPARARAGFVWVEQAVRANLDALLPDVEIRGAHPFRVTRDASQAVARGEGVDMLAATESILEERESGQPVRLEIDHSMPGGMLDMMMAQLGLTPGDIYAADGPVGMNDLMALRRVDRPDLKDHPFTGAWPSPLVGEPDMLSVLRERDILLYHPYDDFDLIVQLMEQAARDPDVLEIRHTLYRVDKESPVMASLMAAAASGKRVTVMVELRARFDEASNVRWARRLTRAGVNVIHGLAELKAHAKASLIVRREGSEIRRYTHIGTGNYHNVTTRIYADLGYLTADPEVGADVADLFDVLAGRHDPGAFRKLLVAPWHMRGQILERIEREIERQQRYGDGLIAFKMNALLDRRCIRALYRASQAGVRVTLQVRGMCALRPGLQGVSENITVTSVVGRFLEHARIYYFRNGGDEEILLGSADLRPRNLRRRVEVLYPVQDSGIRDALRDEILCTHLRDNVKARELLRDGHYRWVRRHEGEPALDSQAWLIAHRGVWHERPEHRALIAS